MRPCELCHSRDRKRGFTYCNHCQILTCYAVSPKFIEVLSRRLGWTLGMIEEAASQITAGMYTERDLLRSQLDPSYPDSWPRGDRRLNPSRGECISHGSWGHAMAVQDFKQISFDNEPIHSKLLYGTKEPMISIITIENQLPTKIERFGCANDAAIALLKDERKEEAYKLVTEPLKIDGQPNPMVSLSTAEDVAPGAQPVRQSGKSYFAQLD